MSVKQCTYSVRNNWRKSNYIEDQKIAKRKISIEKPLRILKIPIQKQMKDKIMHPQRKQAIKRSNKSIEQDKDQLKHKMPN